MIRTRSRPYRSCSLQGQVQAPTFVRGRVLLPPSHGRHGMQSLRACSSGNPDIDRSLHGVGHKGAPTHRGGRNGPPVTTIDSHGHAAVVGVHRGINPTVKAIRLDHRTWELKIMTTDPAPSSLGSTRSSTSSAWIRRPGRRWYCWPNTPRRGTRLSIRSSVSFT